MLNQFLAMFQNAKPTDTLAELENRVNGGSPGTPDPATLNSQLTAANMQIIADMEAMKNGVLNAHAEAHWQALITPDQNGRALATWAERDGIKATYISLARLDGGAKLDSNGQVVMGPHLKTFIDSNLKRTPNFLQGAEIPNGDPRGGTVKTRRTDLQEQAIKSLASAGRISKATATKAIAGIHEGGLN